MSSGVAEIDQQAVAEVLGNMATIAANHLSTRGLIRHRDLTKVFRIKSIGECCGTHQVTEEDRELTTFGRG
jgi:hypothetical protein